MTKRIFLFATLLIALFAVGGAWAQDATPEATAESTPEATPQSTTLSYGTPVTGEITATAFTQDWTLRTASADRVRVIVERVDGNLVPDVLILDGAGTSISQSYGADYTYAVAEIEDFTLPSAGEYTIQVTRDRGESGVTTGAYTLSVIPLGTAPDNPNNQTILGEIQADTPVTGEITAARWLNRYTYTALAADTIQVIARRTDGTLLPQVDILDPNGTSLRTGYNDNATADTGAYTLPAAGDYTITVSRYNEERGSSLGRYEFVVHLVGSGEGSPNLEVAADTAIYDTEITGEITSVRWYQDYQLVTQAGDTISVTVERAGGDLEPEVAILGGSGQDLRHGYTDQNGATAEIERYEFDGPGTYTVRVTRSQGQSGESSGAYTLMIALKGAGEGSPALNEPVGEVTLGEPAEGTITNAQWQNVWTFDSGDATSIDVRVERAAGTLVPTLDIRDINNQSLRTGYYSDSLDSAEIVSYSLPSAGTYHIVVLRYNDQNGETTGDYMLTVSASE